MSIFQMALTFFLVANPIGNSPAIIALIKDLDFERQKKVMIRESLFALFLALFFQYLGRLFLGELALSIYSLRIAGGILLVIVSLGMIFASSQKKDVDALKREPLFVPIGTPLITGPALLTIIMTFAQQEQNNFKVTLAIALAWIGVTGSLLAAPYLNKVLKKRGLVALEQLMGLFLTLMGVSMIIKGFIEFTQSIPK